MKSSPESPEVYIVIVNFNGWQHTIECLESVFRLNYPRYRVVVIDNHSTDNSPEYLLAWAGEKLNVWTPPENPLRELSHPPVPKPIPVQTLNEAEVRGGQRTSPSARGNACKLYLIRCLKNHGFAGGNNLGIRLALQDARCQFIWILNNDTVVEADSLRYLVEWLLRERDEKIGIVGSKLLYYHSPRLIQGIGGEYHPYLASIRHLGGMKPDNGQYDRDDLNPDYPIAASMLVCRKFIEDVGLMSEEYFLFFEELDWVMRARPLGWQFSYCWKSRVYHKEGQTIGAGLLNTEKSEIADYFWLRNRILFTRKYFPRALGAVYLSYLVVIFRRLLRRQWKRIPTIIKIIFST